MRTIRAFFHGGSVSDGQPKADDAQKNGAPKNGPMMGNGEEKGSKALTQAQTQQQQTQKSVDEPTITNQHQSPSVDGSLDTLDGWSEEEVLRWEPNDYEKELVKRTWSDDFDFLYELGAAIYEYIFEHNPQAKQLFPKIHRHGDQWRQSADFRSQALKFVQTLSCAAKNLYHMEQCLVPILVSIGERHVQYASRGFCPEHWNIFLDAMEQALTEHIRSLADFTAQQRQDATRTWRRLSYYIIAHMKMGYMAREAALVAATTTTTTG